MEVLRAHVPNEEIVESLEADRRVQKDVRNVVRSEIHVLVADDEERSRRRAVHEPALRLEHEHTGALTAHERARDIESVLRQELIEVVAGDAPGDVREALPNETGITI